MAIQLEGPSLLIFSQAYGDEKRKKYYVNPPKFYFFERVSTRVKKLESYILVIQDILASESRLLKPASRRDAERLVLEYSELVQECDSRKLNKKWVSRSLVKHIDVMQTDLKSSYKLVLGEITDSNDPVFQAEVQEAFTKFVDHLNKEIVQTGEMEGKARILLDSVQEGISDNQPRVLDQGVLPVSVKAPDGNEDFVVLHDLRDTIHQGGFGLVYKVKRQDNPSMIYAMKIVNGGPETWADLEREKQLWKELHHENILPFAGTVFLDGNDGGLGLLSPFIVHRDLGIIIRKKACTESQRISFLQQISDAIEYLHNLPFIHGDIKPDNILIDYNYKALLCDFGLSKNDVFNNTAPNHIGAGSRGFVAPDQRPNEFDGSHEPKDERSDIFAFGKTMAVVIANQLFRNPPPETPEGVKTDAALAIWDLAELCLSPVASARPIASIVARRLRAIEATSVE